MPPTNNDGEQLLGEITRHVFLVLLRVSWPKLSYQIADAIVELPVNGNDQEKEEIAEEFRTNPQWRLMPEAWRKRLGRLEHRARSLLNSASIQFAARGMAVLPVMRAQQVFSGLREIRTEMQQARDEFVEEYESILQGLRERLSAEMFKKVNAKLPEPAQVARKFEMVWAIVPSGGRGGATPQQLETLQQAMDACTQRLQEHSLPLPRAVRNAHDALQQMRDAVETQQRQITDTEADELVAEARQQMHEFTQEMLEDMAREPRQVIMAAADNLLEALRNPNRMIRNGTIRQVQDAFELLEGFQFLAGDELLARMSECRERLSDVTPQQLNSDAEIGARLAAGLQGMRDAAANAQERTEAVRRFRGIRMRKEPQTES